MSAVWLKLVTILCLSCSALSESSGVVEKDIGGAITIQCRALDNDFDNLIVKKGLQEDEILFKESDSKENIISPEFKGRLQVNGKIPNVDILIKNLTSKDTGPYWCCYSKFIMQTKKSIKMKGNGSVLLLVKGAGSVCPCSAAAPDTTKPTTDCDPANKNLVMVSVVISAAVLLGIIIGVSVWIIKTKTVCRSEKPARVSTNDVYEDMRGTIRR